MAWNRPPADELWRAIQIYLDVAYAGKPVPGAVQSRLEVVRNAGSDDERYGCRSFERDAAMPPGRYSIRLGNATYPHMKLVIEAAPDGAGHLFRADTHDAHCLPVPTSKDYPMVCALIDANGKLAKEIETAWGAAGLPTFREYLKRDLARRATAAKGGQTKDPADVSPPAGSGVEDEITCDDGRA